jgi:TolB-like protein
MATILPAMLFRLCCVFMVSSFSFAFAANTAPPAAATAAGNQGPRLLILQFNNTSHDPNYDYLEGSITESVTQYLRDQFVFQQMSTAQRDEYIRENYYKEKDFFTESVSMKLGLELNQDAVISGSYWVKGGEIITQVRIIDVKNKKVTSQFEMKGPAGSNIFVSVEKIAVRVASEAKNILPNKEEYAKRGATTVSSGPFFSRVSVGARLGGQYYFGGYNDYFKAEQPSFGALLRAFTPYFNQRLGIQTDFNVMLHSLSDKKQSNLNDLGLQSRTTNFMGGASVVYDIALSTRWGLQPYLGIGYIFQSTSVTGSVNQAINNGLPYAQIGFDTTYYLNRFADIVFGPRFYTTYETGTVSFIANFNAGANFKF